MRNRSNNAPNIQWKRATLACGTVRHRLYVNGSETPYFVDDAKSAGIAHHIDGYPVALLGSGMGKEMQRRDGSSYRIAAVLNGGRNVGIVKAAAERMALT